MTQRRLVKLLTVILLAPAAATRADAPPVMSYQGMLTLSDGSVVADDTYQLRFSLWDNVTGGTQQFAETETVSVEGGLYNVILSDPGLVAAVGTGAEPRYIQVEILSGGTITTPVTLLPRQQLASVPYALNAPFVLGLGGACDSSTEGALRYRTDPDPDVRAVEFCNGVEWKLPSARSRRVLDLNGADEYATGAVQAVGLGNAWTLSAWVADRSLAAGSYFEVGTPGPSSITLAQDGAGTIKAAAYDTGGVAKKEYLWSGAVLGGQFHHLALAWDGGVLQLFIDGVAQAPTAIVEDSAIAMADDARQLAAGGAVALDGRLGHVALWDVALAPTEIAEVASRGHDVDLRTAAGSYASTANLVHYYRFGDDPTDLGRDFISTSPIDLVNKFNLTVADDIVPLLP